MNGLLLDEKIIVFGEALKDLVELETIAKKNYSQKHAQMVDLQHEVELSEGYSPAMIENLYNDQKRVAKERRLWKDTLLVIEQIKRNMQDGVDIGDLSDVVSGASKEWGRSYTPRSIKYLDFSSRESLYKSRKNKSQGKHDE